jgi:hypothetical protein
LGRAKTKQKSKKTKQTKKDVAQKTKKSDEEHVHPPINLLFLALLV